MMGANKSSIYKGERLKKLRGLWPAIAGYFIAGGDILGGGFVATAYFTALINAESEMALATFAILLATLVSKGAMRAVIYFILFIIICMAEKVIETAVCRNGRDHMRNHKRIWLAFIAGLGIVTTDLVMNNIGVREIDTTESLLEGVITFSAVVIFERAIRTLEDDYLSVYWDGKSAFSCFALGAVILNGIPLQLFGQLQIMQSVAVFSIMFVAYVYGFGLGVTWTLAAGSVFALKMDDMEYIYAWLLIAIGSIAVYEMFDKGRLLFSIIFSALYFILGLTSYPFLIQIDSLQSIVTALIVFVLLPANMFLRAGDKLVIGNEAVGEQWGALVLSRVKELGLALKRMRYVMAGAGSVSIEVDELGKVIEDFAEDIEHRISIGATTQAKILEQLNKSGVVVNNMSFMKDKRDKWEVYIVAKVRSGRLVSAENVKRIIEENINARLEYGDNSRMMIGKNYGMTCFKEKTTFYCETAVRCMDKYGTCCSGDNFLISRLSDGQQLMIIADGMGSGDVASVQSRKLIDALDDLLQTGFDKDMSIRLVNTFLANANHGENFATLDMMLIDLYTGHAHIYKQGAATTYVQRGQWLEVIKSTALPVGILEDAECEHCRKKLYRKDIILMISDGVLENIVFENKDDYLRSVLERCKDSTPDEIAETIMEELLDMSCGCMKDDATIIVAKLE